MKNIQFFIADKYSQSEYTQIKPNIYQTNKKFVVSISFEQEPEYGEGSSATMISQYPLEDILDRYFACVSDFYPEYNVENSKKCYLELSCRKVERVEELLTIIGKHIYRRTYLVNGEEYSELIIE